MIDNIIKKDLLTVLTLVLTLIISACIMCSEESPERKAERKCTDALEQLTGRQLGTLIHGAQKYKKPVSFSLKLWYCRKIGAENVQAKITWAQKNVKKEWY